MNVNSEAGSHCDTNPHFGRANYTINEVADSHEKKHVRELYGQLDNLKEHWGAGVGSKLTAPVSDHLYKHHLMHLMNIYGTENPEPLGRRIKPIPRPRGVQALTKLYGINGLLRRERTPHELKAREDGWDVYTTDLKSLTPDRHSEHPMLDQSISGNEALHTLHSRPGSASRQTNMRGRTNSPRPHAGTSTRGGSPSGYAFGVGGSDAVEGSASKGLSDSSLKHRPSSARTNRHVQSAIRDHLQTQRPATSTAKARTSTVQPNTSRNASHYDTIVSNRNLRFRTLDNDATMEDMISSGTYRMNKQQNQNYWQFVQMLTKFDPHDIMLILEDVYKDAQACTLLDAYGGFPDDP